MTRRKDVAFPRVSRKVLPAEELYTIDIETGRPTKKMVFCEFHRRMEWVADFYLESQAKSKHAHDIRSMCIEAWDLTEGKLHWGNPKVSRPRKEVTATLMQFFEKDIL